MKLVKREGPELHYELPVDAVGLVVNIDTREFRVISGNRKDEVSSEYQYYDGVRWVKVTPKKSGGRYKGVPVK